MSDKRKISAGGKPTTNSKFVIPNPFSDLIRQIHRTHAELTAQAYKAVNVSLTLRNWLIGLHIAEYEQQGLERAQYGTALLKNLSISLKQLSVSDGNERDLRRYRQFYQEYPQIRGALTPELTDRIPLIPHWKTIVGSAGLYTKYCDTDCMIVGIDSRSSVARTDS